MDQGADNHLDCKGVASIGIICDVEQWVTAECDRHHTGYFCTVSNQVRWVLCF